MRGARVLLALVAALLLCGAAASGAPAATADIPDAVAPATRPPGFRTDAAQATAIARRAPAVADVLRARPDVDVFAVVVDQHAWSIVFTDPVDGRTRAEVAVSARGAVGQAWTGVQASSPLTRDGLDPTFRKPWVWLPFALLFVAPFVDPRRPRRLLHLDLAALLGFGASCVALDRGHGAAAILLFYPPLLYLLGRCVVAGLRPRPRGRLVPLLPTAVLAVGVLGLFGARVALNVHSPQVMDIGVASVEGADRILHREPLYVPGPGHGDTYGPLNYVAYTPFVAALGAGDPGLRAAHAATLAFDLLTLVGLLVLGLRLRAGPEGRRLGLALAWACAACPFTLLGVMDNTNDGLVAALLVWMLVALAAPVARGALLGLATAAKFFPGALLLVVARGRVGGGRRAGPATAGACLGVVAFAIAVYLPAGGLRTFWDCTLGYQLSRPPDLSAWTLLPPGTWLRPATELGVVALVAALSLWRGAPRTPGQVAGLAGAVAIALQLPAGHWFYFYIMWFAPLVLVAVLAEHGGERAAAAAVPQSWSADSAAGAGAGSGSGGGADAAASSRSARLAA